jgi:hypothetical protein
LCPSQISQDFFADGLDEPIGANADDETKARAFQVVGGGLSMVILSRGIWKTTLSRMKEIYDDPVTNDYAG